MKIFLLSNMYPSKSDPLYGVFVKNFRENLEKEKLVFSAVSVIYGRKAHIFSKLLAYIKLYFSAGFNFVFKKYDIIYVHYMSLNTPLLAFLLFLFKNKKPLVMNVHGDDVTASEGKKIDILNKYVLKRTALVVVPSSYFKELVLNNYPFLTQKQVFVSPSGGVNSNIFYPIARAKNELPILGMVSRIDAGKGWDDLLKALKSLKSKNIVFNAVIAGIGPEEEKMKAMLQDFDLCDEVEYLGPIRQDKLIHLYTKIDVLIFPTKREAESLGLVGLEAMSCGVPVIGGNIAGLKTYIDDGKNGILFEPGSVPALVQSIEEYLNLSVSQKSEMKNAANETAKKYESTFVTIKLKERLEDLI